MNGKSRAHIAINTEKLNESIQFYAAFFGVKPSRRRKDYAKFSVENPALNFTLNYGKTDEQGKGVLNHLGIEVISSSAVRQAMQRLKAAGFQVVSEQDTDCCYAMQDKVWVSDPNGNNWEIFTVKAQDK